MAYSIEPKSTKDFISMQTNLPRFQRKQTWKPISNFKLCISIFKTYPIGVVIVNKNEAGNWLLDGRQRLNALTQISNNPEEVYRWAMKFIKFKASSQPDEIKAKYREKINEYLKKDYEDMYDEKQQQEEEDDKQELNIESDTIIEKKSSFDPNEQNDGLNILLDLILMVHNFRSGKSSWERTFDFSKIIDKQLTYYNVENGKQVFCPQELVKVIEEIISIGRDNKIPDLVTKELVLDYYCKRYYLDEKITEKLKNAISSNWDDIYFSFVTINKVKRVLEDSKIGIIEINMASDLDAQNIFSLVNSGGTQLTAEELLSAKPYWNIKVPNASDEVSACIKDLYSRLGVMYEGDVVRWDLCATLISRIDKNGFIFNKRRDEDSLASETTLGFKLFSAIYKNGISSNHVSSIEEKEFFNWEVDFEKLVGDLNDLCDLIEDHKYFRCFKKWGQSIMSVTSNTIALEFITIMYKEWIKIGKKKVDCSETKALKRNAVILLDKLIYEYSCKQWRGSSDSKLASDITNIDERLIPKSNDDWNDLLDSLSKGVLNDQVVTQNLIKPILFHGKSLSQEFPSVTDANVNYDLDHIYPKAQFNKNRNVNQNLRDSLCNLQILSSQANKEKNDSKLTDVTEPSVIDEITKSSGIMYEDFSKYSSISNIDDMINSRLIEFKKIYKDERNKMLAD